MCTDVLRAFLCHSQDRFPLLKDGVLEQLLAAAVRKLGPYSYVLPCFVGPKCPSHDQSSTERPALTSQNLTIDPHAWVPDAFSAKVPRADATAAAASLQPPPPPPLSALAAGEVVSAASGPPFVLPTFREYLASLPSDEARLKIRKWRRLAYEKQARRWIFFVPWDSTGATFRPSRLASIALRRAGGLACDQPATAPVCSGQREERDTRKAAWRHALNKRPDLKLAGLFPPTGGSAGVGPKAERLQRHGTSEARRQIQRAHHALAPGPVCATTCCPCAHVAPPRAAEQMSDRATLRHWSPAPLVDLETDAAFAAARLSEVEKEAAKAEVSLPATTTAAAGRYRGCDLGRMCVVRWYRIHFACAARRIAARRKLAS